MTRRRVLRFGLAALSMSLLAPPWARAQTRYPERPIRLILELIRQSVDELYVSLMGVGNRVEPKRV